MEEKTHVIATYCTWCSVLYEACWVSSPRTTIDRQCSLPVVHLFRINPIEREPFAFKKELNVKYPRSLKGPSLTIKRFWSEYPAWRSREW